MPSTSSVPNVLLIRLSAIGDIVMASGLPCSIKDVMPNAKISWLIEPPYADMVQYHSQVDEVICWPKDKWRKLAANKRYFALLKAIWRFRNTLKAKGFTHAIDAQGLLKSAFLAWLSGAPKRIGFVSKEHSHALLTHAIEKPISTMISSEYRVLAKWFNSHHYILNIQVSDKANQSALATLKRVNIASPFIALAPFTTRPQKHWPQGHWITLMNEIRRLTSMPIAILGGPDDECKAQALSFSANNVYCLAGHTSLPESIAIIQHCALLIGVDTGLTHIGTSFTIPTVALFGSTCPYTETDSPFTQVLYKNLSCAPCKRRPTCEGAYNCMEEITPAHVLSAIREYL